MRATVATFLLLLSEVAYAEVLPCRAEPATAYDTDSAAVRYAAQTGRAFFGAVLGVPVGLALAVIGIPIGAATSTRLRKVPHGRLPRAACFWRHRRCWLLRPRLPGSRCLARRGAS